MTLKESSMPSRRGFLKTLFGGAIGVAILPATHLLEEHKQGVLAETNGVPFHSGKFHVGLVQSADDIGKRDFILEIAKADEATAPLSSGGKLSPEQAEKFQDYVVSAWVKIPPDGAFHHVSCSFSKDQAKSYVDGKLQSVMRRVRNKWMHMKFIAKRHTTYFFPKMDD